MRANAVLRNSAVTLEPSGTAIRGAIPELPNSPAIESIAPSEQTDQSLEFHAIRIEGVYHPHENQHPSQGPAIFLNIFWQPAGTYHRANPSINAKEKRAVSARGRNLRTKST
jgi:hypothetical protein